MTTAIRRVESGLSWDDFVAEALKEARRIEAERFQTIAATIIFAITHLGWGGFLTVVGLLGAGSLAAFLLGVAGSGPIVAVIGGVGVLATGGSAYALWRDRKFARLVSEVGEAHRPVYEAICGKSAAARSKRTQKFFEELVVDILDRAYQMAAEEMAARFAGSATLDRRAYIEKFLHDLTECIPEIEDEARALRETKEEALTVLLKTHLRPHLLVREAEAKGHVDLVLLEPGSATKLLKFEAKVVDRGERVYADGVNKLAFKYANSRDEVAVMIGYCRLKNMRQAMGRHRKHLGVDGRLCCLKRLPPSAFPAPESPNLFRTFHRDTERGREVTVVHVWIDLFCETDEEMRKPA